MRHKVGDRILGWAGSGSEAERADALELERRTLNSLAISEREAWVRDPIRQAMGKALAREHEAWRQYRDEDDALAAITATVKTAAREWGKAVAALTGPGGGRNDFDPIHQMIARGILHAWKEGTIYEGKQA